MNSNSGSFYSQLCLSCCSCLFHQWLHSIYSRRQKSIYEQLFLREQEFRMAQEEFRITLYSIGDAVITTDPSGHIRHMNMAAEKLTGWRESEASGKRFEECHQNKT